MNYGDIKITDSVKYIGADDKDLDLFEGQYIIPNGVAYNSYVILDEKIAVMDTIDIRKSDEWLSNLDTALDGRTPDYLVMQHMEPDHSASLKLAAEKYPNMKIVGNAKTFNMINQFFDIDIESRKLVVGEGDTLSLGKHELHFVMAPMVHWPEVMVTYDSFDKILFSADGFGKFGALDTDEEWDCEARRYYFNIVGKYGAQVQALLKKAAVLDIEIICPLHGPILKEDLSHYIGLYDTWSRYMPETSGVFIAYASVYGNTEKAAYMLKDMLEAKNVKVAISDLAREDWAEALEDAFRYDRMVIASPTYNAGIFTAVNDFLSHLEAKSYQSRKVGIIENGTWAPMAAKKIKEVLSGFKDIEIIEPTVTIKSALKPENTAQLEVLANALSE